MLACSIRLFKNAMPSLSFTYLIFSHLYPKEENGSRFKKTSEYVLKLCEE